MSRPPFRVRDVRDGVLLADLPESSEGEANRLCVALARALRSSAPRGLLDAVPAARSLLLVFDPLRLSAGRLRDAIARHPGEDPGEGGHRLLRVPVAYGHGGPDLDALARSAGVPPEEIARSHAAAEYRVAFLGFAPGFAYLSGLPAELAAARLPSPRTRVPAGSVAIGGLYTGVYPEDSPGGWRLIGRTTIRLLDPHADPPALLRPGDRVRFEAVRPEDLPRLGPPPKPAPRGAPLLRVLAPGLATTVQGEPLDGWRSSGIPAGGAIDPVSLSLANARAGNAPGAPGLELPLRLRGAGPELEALEDCMVACEGDFPVEVNGRASEAGAALRLAAGDRLRLGRAREGTWGYVAVRGGLEPPSRFAPRPRLAAGDLLAAAPRERGDDPARRGEIRDRSAPDAALALRVLPGPEADAFAPQERERFFASSWRVSPESDRRGFRLEGPAPLAHRVEAEIPPSGTVPGTIQVPGGGLPIVLGPDGPVTGGYPRIATVIGVDLPLLGRAAPGGALRFEVVTLAQALEARRAAAVGVS